MTINPKQLAIFDTPEETLYVEIFDIFSDTESDEIEYKSAMGGFPKEFWKTYSAFANSSGGVIVLGVKETNKKFVIEGLTDQQIQSYRREFWNNANNKNTVSLNLLSDKDVKVIESGTKKLLGFRIPVATRTQRPVYLTSNPFDNTYKRNHEGDYCCTRDEVRRMLADADLKTHADSRILAGYTMNDFDMPSIRQFRNVVASVRPGHAWLSLEDKELLRQLGAYRVDRTTRREGPTVAGILMFGKSLSIIDQECCPNYFPDYREILTQEPQIRWTDRIYPDGNWECNLFQFYRVIWTKLSSNLPKPFQLEKGIRQDETPTHKALREAFVNTLVHTDYTAPGNIVIEQRIEDFRFTNPGTLLVTMEQYYQGGISECRNPSLQKMFMLMGVAEKAGSGVNEIFNGWRFAHWRPPYLSVKSSPDRAILYLPMFSMLSKDTIAHLHKLYGENVDLLGKDELTVLSTCHIEKEVTNNRLQYIVDLHPTDITKLLQKLCESGYLQQDRKGRWTSYRLKEEKVDTSNQKVDTSNQKVDTSNQKVDTSRQRTQSYYKKEKLTQMILSFCELEYRSLEEISSYIQRDSKYLKNKIMPNLIKKGDLIKLHPNIPNHPGQAYRKADK